MARSLGFGVSIGIEVQQEDAEEATEVVDLDFFHCNKLPFMKAVHNNYILVIEDEKPGIPNIESTDYIQSMKGSREANRSIDVFSFSDQREILERRDFEDYEIQGMEAQVQYPQLNETKRLVKMKYVALLEALFICLTARLKEKKSKAFEMIKDCEYSEINICKMSMSSIAQEKIIPWVSEEILKRSYRVSRTKTKESSPKNNHENRPKPLNFEKVTFRFGLQMQRVSKSFLLKKGFKRIRQCNPQRLTSLREIKKVQSRGQFTISTGEKRNRTLEVKIIAKYMKKLILAWSFGKLKLRRRLLNIEKGGNVLVRCQKKLQLRFFLKFRSSQLVEKSLNKLSKSLNLHVIRLQYKLIIQAFYKLKNVQAAENQSIRACNILQRLFSKKEIKHIFGGFVKMKQNAKYNPPMKSSCLNGFLTNFSQLMETKTKSRIQCQSLFDGDDSLNFTKGIQKNMEGVSIGYIQINSSLPPYTLSKHERPLPPQIFSYKFASRIPKPVVPDEFTGSSPDQTFDS